MTNTTLATPTHTPQLQAFKQVIKDRRSVRLFTDTIIPDEVLDDCLHLAMLAPNSSNLQPWEFYVIETPVKRTQASKICMNQNAAKTANKLVVIVGRTDTWSDNAKQILQQHPTPVPKAVNDYYSKLIPFMFTRGTASILGVPKRGLVKAYRTFKGAIADPVYNYNDIKEWALTNSYLAAENFMLALRAYGFDSCPMGGFDEQAMKKLLNLDDHQHIAMVVACGERAEKGVYSEQYRFADGKNIFKV